MGAKTVEYTVVADAVTITTGEKNAEGKPEVIRLVAGEAINAPADHPTVLVLKGQRAIRETAKVDAVKDRLSARKVYLLGQTQNEVEESAPLREDAAPLNATLDDLRNAGE